MPGHINPSKLTRFKIIVFPWAGTAMTITATANQEKSFNSLAQVILYNRVTLDHILAEKVRFNLFLRPPIVLG